MGKSTGTRISKAQRRGMAGGRPRKEGARYPSGQLKPVGPNPRVLEARQAICDDPRMATCPLDAAFANGWLSREEYETGVRYVAAHTNAQLGAPGSKSGAWEPERGGAINDLHAQWTERWSKMTDTQVRTLKWNELTQYEIAKIWDSAMRPAPSTTDRRGISAMRRYKRMNDALTPAQRHEVHSVCVLESWPQWILQRRAGRFQSSWETRRDVLIDGLHAIEAMMIVDQPVGEQNAYARIHRARLEELAAERAARG